MYTFNDTIIKVEVSQVTSLSNQCWLGLILLHPEMKSVQKIQFQI